MWRALLAMDIVLLLLCCVVVFTYNYVVFVVLLWRKIVFHILIF